MDREDEITIEVRLLRDRNHQLSQALEDARKRIHELETSHSRDVLMDLTRQIKRKDEHISDWTRELSDARVEISRLEAIVDGLKAEITRERGIGVGSKDA